MGIKSYIRGFTTFPIDTREMTSATNTVLAQASAAILASDSITIALSNTKIEWTFFGAQTYVTILYQV